MILRKLTRPNSLSIVRGFFSGLSENHRLVQETCRKFANDEIRPVAAENDEQKKFPEDIIRKLGQYSGRM